MYFTFILDLGRILHFCSHFFPHFSKISKNPALHAGCILQLLTYGHFRFVRAHRRNCRGGRRRPFRVRHPLKSGGASFVPKSGRPHFCAQA